MNKTITVPQNGTQEMLVIVAQKANDISEQKTRFTDIRNIIVAEDADDKYEQMTGFSGIPGLDLPDIIDPRDQCHAIARDRDNSCINSEHLSSENKTGIRPSCKGVPT